MKVISRIGKSLKYRIFDHDYVPHFARKSIQPAATKLLNLSIRLLGFNNYGPSSKSGEEYFLTRFVKTDPEFCIDVGANIGKYSEFLLRNSASSVLAFEPLPVAFERLRLLKDQFGSRFVIENQGCAQHSGKLKLNYGSDLSELASFSIEVNEIEYVGASNVNEILVRTTSLDDYFHPILPTEVRRCDLLKIDTEGFEYEVLLGSSEFIASFRPRIIQIEFNLHHLYRRHSLKLLGDLLSGYQVFRILPSKNGLTPCSSEDFASNIFQYSNYIFIANEWYENSDYRNTLGI